MWIAIGILFLWNVTLSVALLWAHMDSIKYDTKHFDNNNHLLKITGNLRQTIDMLLNRVISLQGNSEKVEPLAQPSGPGLTCSEVNWLFPVIKISCTGSTLAQVIEERHDIGTGDNGLAIGVKRIITTHKPIQPA